MEIVGRQQKKLGRALLSTMSSSYKSISGMCRYLLTPILNFHDDFNPHLTCRSKARRELSQGNLNKNCNIFIWKKWLHHSIFLVMKTRILYSIRVKCRLGTYFVDIQNKTIIKTAWKRLFQNCVSLRKKQKNILKWNSSAAHFYGGNSVMEDEIVMYTFAVP